MTEYFMVQKLYEDGWKCYCVYDTLEEAELREKIVQERDLRQTRIKHLVEKDETNPR